MAVTSVTAANAAATQSATSASAGGFKLFGGKGISFFDVIRVVGGGLIAGPIGAALSFAGVVAEKSFHKDDAAPDATASTDQVAANAANPNASLAENTSPIRPGGWMINMAYGERDPYRSTPSNQIDNSAPGTAVAAATSINDPRLAVAANVAQQRPGGWIVNAAYAGQDAYERAQTAGLSGLNARA